MRTGADGVVPILSISASVCVGNRTQRAPGPRLERVLAPGDERARRDGEAQRE